MADYHPLVARAVAGLDENTAEARRALYERARAALVKQLRGTNPPLSESDITRERLALEEAIRRVEAEQARRGRLERTLPERTLPERTPLVISPPEPADEVPPRDAKKAMAVAAAVATGRGLSEKEEPPVERPVQRWPKAPPQEIPIAAPEPAPAGVVAKQTEPPASADRQIGPPDASEVSDADVPLKPRVSDPPAEPPPAAQEEPESAPLGKALHKLRDRFKLRRAEEVPPWPRVPPPEPPHEKEDAPPPDAAAPPLEEHASGPVAPARHMPKDADRPSARPAEMFPEPEHADVDVQPRRRLSGTALKVAVAIVVIAVLAALAAVGLRESGSLVALYRLLSGPEPTVTREEAKATPKIEDRIGSAQPDRIPGAVQPAPGTGVSPAVAQRVVLYEEDPGDAAGKRYIGSAIWRTETVSPGPGLAPELAVKADIEIPERRITMAFSMVRNTDPKLPASHTIDIRFNLPPGFSGVGIANVPGILMKEAEQTRGVPLAGIAVKVTDNVFLIGLSSVESDVQRNTQLLKERPWFDIPIVYANGSRAILAMEKGTPGERAFNDAFTVWGRSGTAAR